MTRAVVAVVLLGGCYAPTVADGLPCSESYDCPDGQACDVATGTCFVDPPDSRVLQYLSVGGDHACGIGKAFESDPGGTLWCWGSNSDRQLGSDGPASVVPIQVGTDDDWVTVTAGVSETIGIRVGGTMWAWGESNPVSQVGAGTEWQRAFAGDRGECALDVDGALWCSVVDGITPEDPGPWRYAETNDQHICAIDPDDRLFCWGQNDEGEVGNGSTTDVDAPFEVMPGAAFLDVATAANHTCAVRDDGVAFCWGDCQFGQLGDGADPVRECDDHVTTPTQVLGDGYVDVSAFDAHTCAVRADRTIACWGYGAEGETGAGVERHADPRVVLGNNWTFVAAGRSSTCAHDANARAFCWGANGVGQLGDGNGGHVREPEQIAAGASWRAVHAGDRSTCAIENNGSLWCWGRNGRGELGTGSTLQAGIPTQVGDAIDWDDVSVGRDHGCGVLGGFLHCWGAQSVDVLGGDLLAPVELGVGDGWTDVAAATSYTCALHGDGELWCWEVGRSPTRIDDALGWSGLTSSNDTVQDSTICAIRDGRASCIRGDLAVLAQAPNVTDFQQISTGYQHSCGIRADGTAWCWGTNGYGELGNDTVVDRSDDAVPVALEGELRDIATGLNFSCGVLMDSTLWCWGRNTQGNLGDGSSVFSSFEPVRITGDGWLAVSAGRDHACALRDDDTLWCWGSDDNDQLGRGLGGSTTPVRVLP